MLQKIFGYRVELVEHSPDYTLVRSDNPVAVGTQIPVRVSGANGKRTPSVPMIVISCRPCEHDGYLVTGRFLVEHPDLSGFAIPPGIDEDSSVRSDPRVNCHLCVISRDLPGYRVMTIDLSEGGLQVEAPSRVALGSTVLLRLEFDTDKLPAIQAAATVAWCRKSERKCYKIGLKFKNLDEHSSQIIGLYRKLVEKRAASDITTRTIKDESSFVEEVAALEGSDMPTLQVLHWHQIPLFEEPVLVGYRRFSHTLQVRLRGGRTGVRYREYAFTEMRGMRDEIEADIEERNIAEFRYAEADSGYYRFQFLDEHKTPMMEVEAKACSEQSSEQN